MFFFVNNNIRCFIDLISFYAVRSYLVYPEVQPLTERSVSSSI